MKEIDVTLNMADFTPNFWCDYWENPMGKSKKDPDSSCLLLQEYHSKLWSRVLPINQKLELKKGHGSNYLTWKNFRFGSDSIRVSFRYEKLKSFIERVKDEVVDYKTFIQDYVKISYTIGGFIIFPKKKGGINQSRGCNPFIRDRFDLTLECIRRYYNREFSPLFNILNDNKDFFDLFVDFRGYVDFFFLQDLVSEDYKSVNFWIGKGDLKENPFPSTVDEYLLLISKELKFVEKRNHRINEFIQNPNKKPY